MYTDTEGIVLKQMKITGGRRMILLFSKKYGKISCGTSITEKGKGKAALALRPFAYGRYELNKTRSACHLNGGEVIKSHYQLGEDIEKYMQASYVMELTEKLLPEEAPAQELFLLLSDFLDMMDKRTKKYGTLVLAYLVKALKYSGSMPELSRCVLCGKEDPLNFLSVEEGGLVCDSCKSAVDATQRLISISEFGIVDILRYLLHNPLMSFERLALDDAVSHRLMALLKAWMAYHLEISGLKSEEFIS